MHHNEMDPTTVDRLLKALALDGSNEAARKREWLSTIRQGQLLRNLRSPSRLEHFRKKGALLAEFARPKLKKKRALEAHHARRRLAQERAVQTRWHKFLGIRIP